MSSTFQKDQRRVTEANQVADNMQRLREWIAFTHPEVKLGISVENAFTDYFGNRLFTPLSREDFEFAFTRINTKYSRQHIPTQEEIRQEMEQMPVEDLKELVKASRPDYSTYPRLPKVIVPVGSTTAVPLTAQYIRQQGVWEIRRLQRLYGSAQINQRLREG
jgi:hypothetical protein